MHRGIGQGGINENSRYHSHRGTRSSYLRVHRDIEYVADSYVAEFYIQSFPKSHHYLTVDEATARRIADIYEALPHAPNDPAVKTPYDSFKAEIYQQYCHAIQRGGMNFEPWNEEGQPYRNSAEMIFDVRFANHLYFFRGGEFPADHPLGAIETSTGFTYNELFRAIHDYFGHAQKGYQFGPRGEENAWHEHGRMFSAAALPAMTWETRGQTCWVNFGPHLRTMSGHVPRKGEKGFVPLALRPYAEQKANIMPAEFILPRNMNEESKGERRTIRNELEERS